ncbi:MAG: dihydroorotate dehydrogenase [Deltaproteobacteria bacterium]
MKPNLAVQIGSVTLKNPVLTASGTFGYGREFEEYVDPARLGGVVTKTITREPWQGNAAPRLCETAAGMLNAIGLQNDGVERFLTEKAPCYKGFPTRLIVSVGGHARDEYARVIERLETCPAIDAYELNISCPNIECADRLIAQDPALTRETVACARRATKKPLIVKLSPNVRDIVEIALAAEEAGADAVSLINTLIGMAVDVARRRPVLANVTGGLSGPAVKPVALRMVWQVAQKVKVPVIGMGGILSARDALEFLIAGATAVAVGTASFVEPGAAAAVAKGIEDYCVKHKVRDIKDIIGSLKVE